ncbi:AAA family ATPase [Chitinophaga ginsengisoli]|uniref:ATPase family protein associated with various cellular activities (AAA) n=1 Tax=Chitinophaga ginsengisoli TaxID=363837 RepID=A0A2P8FUH9_9BACT|nr:ATP-binding protein [Chitinophaga ginsengisoli]PSL25383.1 ATPase family protein associated with various cellular activities (AAA) [Chitinophaga ginsengisoli]
MNQDLLVRLFRSIEGDQSEDIVLVAQQIILDETQKGHTKLANRLKEILQKNISTYSSFRGELKSLLPSGVSIPKDKRHNIPLATLIERESLRHYMVLPQETELKIQRIEKEFVAKDRLGHYGLKPKQKILLYGAPGCGKSMAAERIAWTVGLPFLKVRFEAVISSYLGESASNLKSLFESIASFPCVLLLDEFDFIAKARSATGQDVGEMHRLVNLLLNLLEDYNAPGILIATTNFEGIIDHALFRRFDEIIEMPKPSSEQVLKILQQTLSSVPLARNIQWKQIVDALKGTSAATVVKIATDASKLAIIEGEKEVKHNHLELSLKENALLIDK